MVKRCKILFAAVLVLAFTACSFFYEDSKSESGSAEISDGSYSCKVELSGGSGKASVDSPAEVTVSGETMLVELVWSSSNYDYILVDGIRYENEADAGENSTFTIPFYYFNQEFDVIADTTAMSTPHEIEYEITVFSPFEENESEDEEESDSSGAVTADESANLGSLVYQYSLELDYASEFSVDYYSDAENNVYAFITIKYGDANQYFLKAIDGADGTEVLDISDNIVLLDNIDETYLVSTSVMDLIANIDGLSNIGFTGTKIEDWYIDQAIDAMSLGEILYAGKYSAPDYELLVSEGCNFAIENTMIYHNPEVKEKLEELGIPVLVETSSYESSPLGRLEWIKLYGALFNKLDEAEAFFYQQKERVLSIQSLENTDKKVAFFSINSNGQITVRKNGDYISSMIEMAGGSYVPEELSSSDNSLSTIKITTEEFYLSAVDADVLIYNSTIVGEIDTVDELVSKVTSLGDFEAVNSKNVYCLKEEYFQKSTSVAEFIEELHSILTGNFEEGECFYKLKE